MAYCDMAKNTQVNHQSPSSIHSARTNISSQNNRHKLYRGTRPFYTPCRLGEFPKVHPWVLPKVPWEAPWGGTPGGTSGILPRYPWGLGGHPGKEPRGGTRGLPRGVPREVAPGVPRGVPGGTLGVPRGPGVSYPGVITSTLVRIVDHPKIYVGSMFAVSQCNHEFRDRRE